ncbi:MAG: hypothetical protein VW362_09480 [Candidatus Nanopelagicales bacterium]
MTEQTGADPSSSTDAEMDQPQIVEEIPPTPPAYGVLEGREPQAALEKPAVVEAIETSHTEIRSDEGTVVVETAAVRVAADRRRRDRRGQLGGRHP